MKDVSFYSISLPLLHIEGDVCDEKSYDQGGLYFVETKQNIHYIVEVDKETENVWSNPLPPSISKTLIMGEVINSVKEELTPLLEQVKDDIKANIRKSEESLYKNSLSPLIDEIKILKKESKESLRYILEQAQENLDKAGLKGSISESALIEILKIIK